MRKSEQVFFDLLHLGVAINQLNKRSEKKLGLSLVQWCSLKNLIDMPAATAHALASAVGVHPSTLTQTLKRLERKKYVFIMEDPADSRKKLISITRLGKNVMESASDKMSTLSTGLIKLEKELVLIQSFLKTQSPEKRIAQKIKE